MQGQWLLAGLAAAWLGCCGGLLAAAPARAANSDHVKQLILNNSCPDCDLSGADLRKLKLRRANLNGANLTNADLRRADLREAGLAQASLLGAKLRDSRLRGADLTRADLRRADLRDADLRDSVLVGADFQNADLSNAELAEARVGRTNFVGARGLAPEIMEQGAWKPDQQTVIAIKEPNFLVRVWRFVTFQ